MVRTWTGALLGSFPRELMAGLPAAAGADASGLGTASAKGVIKAGAEKGFVVAAITGRSAPCAPCAPDAPDGMAGADEGPAPGPL